MKARHEELYPMAEYEVKTKKSFWNRFWDLFYANDAPSYDGINEREYEKAVTLVAEETREYIARIRNSSAVNEIASQMSHFRGSCCNYPDISSCAEDGTKSTRARPLKSLCNRRNLTV